MNGVLETKGGKRVANASVDLLGPYAIIHRCLTRDDGTFTMFIDAPPDTGYYLQLRYRGGQRTRISPFALDSARRVLALRIQVR